MLTFMWDLSDKGFEKLVEAQRAEEGDDYAHDDMDCVGSCFVGDFKFEIMVASLNICYIDTLFKVQTESNLPIYYDRLKDGTPYDSLGYEYIPLPKRRSIGHFMKEFELRVLDTLKQSLTDRKIAERPTLPYHWYEDWDYRPIITREVMYE